MADSLNTQKALIMSAFLLPALLAAPLAFAGIDCPPDRIDARYQVAHIYDGDTVRLRNGDNDKTKGFSIVKGTLNQIQRQHDTLYLNLQNRIRLRINRHEQKYFDTAFLQGLVGKCIRIRVRGWITSRNNTLHMRLRHPAAIEVE